MRAGLDRAGGKGEGKGEQLLEILQYTVITVNYRLKYVTTGKT